MHDDATLEDANLGAVQRIFVSRYNWKTIAAGGNETRRVGGRGFSARFLPSRKRGDDKLRNDNLQFRCARLTRDVTAARKGGKKNARRGSGELIKRIAAVIQCLCAVTFMARLNRDGMESFGGRICGCAISGCVRISKKKKKKRVVRFEGNKTRYRRLIKRRRKQSSRSLASSVKLDTCQRVTFPKGYTFSYLNQKRDT